MSTPQATERPQPLPANLLFELVIRGATPLLLALDYDGTLSPIVPDPASAVPAHGAKEVLKQLASHPELVRVAIVSGRDIDQLCAFLDETSGVALIGVHGLEMMEPSGARRIVGQLGEDALKALEKVRQWLADNVPPNAGFLVEEKRFSIALHYRNAQKDQVKPIVQALEDFIRQNTPELRAGHGKMVIEALPKGASKGCAIRLLESYFKDTKTTVYFGDDITDEDAFYELRSRGVTVKVGDDSPSWAKYRVESPAQVVQTLNLLADAIKRQKST